MCHEFTYDIGERSRGKRGTKFAPFAQRHLYDATLADSRCAMPDARQLIRDTTFDADTVNMMGGVLDAAWELIEHAFDGQPQATVDAARSMLAKAIIDRVSLGLLQPEILKDEAIRAVKLSYPNLPI